MEGACHREAELRELTGEEESYLVEPGAPWLPAQWATEVLARCLVSLGEKTPVTRDAVRSLTVGDREALLLQLRRISTGDPLQCILTCPSPDCRRKMDLELKVSDLLVPPCSEAMQTYETTVEDAGQAYWVRFRVPTGSDQEAAAALARSDLGGAEELLLRRCVELVTGVDGAGVDSFPAAIREQLPARMAELDSQAELTLRLTCPVCYCPFAAIFDAISYVFEEMRARVSHLYREVHLLAYHYHWSLSEILGMHMRTRRRYLQLLEDDLAKPRQP